ncbi:MAG: RIP metalloprotease RseP, partial [Vicinamibacteria bacterium]|nr:RIP metalloprotease RseP [Vicinamibacteria bacterium]
IDVRPIADGPERLGRIGVYPMVHVLELINDAPAMKAGVQLDDGLLFVDETPIRAPEDLSKAIIVRGEKTLQLTLYRQGQILTLGLTPRDSGDGPKIGVKPGAEHVLRRFGPIAALGAGIRYTAEMTGQVLGVLKGLVTRRVSPKAMGGLVGIAKGAAASANLGPLDFFVFIAFLSINVGILNLVPIVPLDGGHMFILLIEGAIRRNLNEKVKEWVMYAGTAAILLLFVFVLYSDFSKTELLRKYLP